MPKCDCNFTEITLRYGCSLVSLLDMFRTPFLKNTSEWLVMYFVRSDNLIHVKRSFRRYLKYVC